MKERKNLNKRLLIWNVFRVVQGICGKKSRLPPLELSPGGARKYHLRIIQHTLKKLEDVNYVLFYVFQQREITRVPACHPIYFYKVNSLKI